MNPNILHKLSSEVKKELLENILPFWMDKMVDHENGGFYGRISGDDTLIPLGDKGAVLNARILWTFSASYLATHQPEYLEMAKRSFDYNVSSFFDNEYDGTFWMLDCYGKPKDSKKQIYAIAFFIYAFSEYYRASGSLESLDRAIELYSLIEKYSFDPVKNGYFEAFDRQWGSIGDLRLSDKDANEKKTMNTHLHVLEAYANLYKVWKDEGLKNHLKNLIGIFLDKIVDPHTFHLGLFFNEDWECKSSLVSYGHDIEASWLLVEAAELLDDKVLLDKTKNCCMNIAKAATEGLQPDGSLIYEKNHSTGHTDSDRHWWPQAEAVTGFFHAYRLTGERTFLHQAVSGWEYIKKHLVDKEKGEWHWSIKADGSVNRVDDKAGFWKCPYHNSRMCIEIMHGAANLLLR